MIRDLGKRTVFGLALLGAAAGLTACGSDDSSASSTPTFTSSSVVPSAESTTSTTSTESTTSAAATTSPGAAATAPEEAQEPVPSGFPGPTAAPVEPRGTDFVAALRQRGVTVAGNGDIAISTANYICLAQSEGVAPDQIATFVTANVGAEASASGTVITPEQAGQSAQTYIDVATTTYCS